MNMRQHKHFVLTKMAIHISDRYWQGVIDRALAVPAEDRAAGLIKTAEVWDKLWGDIESKQAQRQLVEEPAPSETFTVARKKDGEIVGTFESLELAQAEIDKAKRAKKATLVLV